MIDFEENFMENYSKIYFAHSSIFIIFYDQNNIDNYIEEIKSKIVFEPLIILIGSTIPNYSNENEEFIFKKFINFSVSILKMKKFFSKLGRRIFFSEKYF
jgi:hypothetical protein